MPPRGFLTLALVLLVARNCDAARVADLDAMKEEASAKVVKTSQPEQCQIDGCDPANAGRYNPMFICRARCASKGSGCSWNRDKGCENKGSSLMQNQKKKKKEDPSKDAICRIDGCDPANAGRYNPMFICRARCAARGSGCAWDSDEGCEYRGSSLMQDNKKQVQKKKKGNSTEDDECQIDGCDPADAHRFNPMFICRARCASKYEDGCAWDSDVGCEWRGDSLMQVEKKQVKKKKGNSTEDDECQIDGCDPADAHRFNPMFICRARCASKHEDGCAWDSDVGCEWRGDSLMQVNKKQVQKKQKRAQKKNV